MMVHRNIWLQALCKNDGYVWCVALPSGETNGTRNTLRKQWRNRITGTQNAYR